MIKATKTKRFTADTWLTNNFNSTIEKYSGRYVIIVDDHGLVFTDKDGSPKAIVKKAKRKYPECTPLFFRVPRSDEFKTLCVLNRV